MSYGTLQIEKMTTESGYSLGAGNASSFKNRIINGAMVIDQRNAGASVTPSNSATSYAVDRFSISVSQNSKCTIQQNAGSVTPPTGFTNYYGFTVDAAATVTVGASDYWGIQHRIEGNNLADLDFGKSTAKTFTISFWVRSSVTGTFGLALQNGGQTRSYATTYTINSANTWEQKTITIAGDTSGTWATNNTAGLVCTWGLGIGSTYAIAAGSSWTTTSSPAGFGVTGTVQLIQTNSATFYITGVQLEVGTVATSFDFRSFGTELQLCKRYFETSYNYGTAVGAVTVDGNVLWLTSQQWGVTSVPNGPIIQGSVVCEVAKRAVATIVGYSTNTGASGKFVLGSTNLDVTYANWLQQAPSTRHIGYPQNAGGAGFGNTDSVRFQWTASAEL